MITFERNIEPIDLNEVHMLRETLFYKQGATGPSIYVNVIDKGSRQPLILDDYSVFIRAFRMNGNGDLVLAFERECIIDQTRPGVAFYEWQPGDLANQECLYCSFVYFNTLTDTEEIYPLHNYVNVEIN